jgi:hypothetical protein
MQVSDNIMSWLGLWVAGAHSEEGTVFVDGPDPKQKRSLFSCVSNPLSNHESIISRLVSVLNRLSQITIGVSLSLYFINILNLYNQSATWFGSKFPVLQNMMHCIFVYR